MGQNAEMAQASDPPPPREVVRYGPEIPDEDALRLLGTVADKRVLVLGLHRPSASIALAQQGARVVVVDPDQERLDRGRTACEEAEAKAEFRKADLAGLAFLPGDSFDLVLSIYTLTGVDDLNRVFRQVHRVLKADGALVLSLPHPAHAMLDADRPPRLPDDPVLVAHPYPGTAGRNEGAPAAGAPAGDPYAPSPATTPTRTWAPSEVFTAMHRAKFRLDALLEPAAATTGPRGPQWTELLRWAPPTLVLRGRKEGI